MTDLDDKTKQVADAYWGSGTKPANRDVHGLGDPPRPLTEVMRRYILTETSNMFGMWIACAVLFSGVHAVTIVASGNLWFPPVLPLLFIVLAIVSGRRRADHRRRLTRVLTEGQITGAIVRNIHQLERGRFVTTTVTYRVEGTQRDISISSVEQSLAFLQVGLRDEVIYLAAEPGIVIPTFMLA